MVMVVLAGCGHHTGKATTARNRTDRHHAPSSTATVPAPTTAAPTTAASTTAAPAPSTTIPVTAAPAPDSEPTTAPTTEPTTTPTTAPTTPPAPAPAPAPVGSGVPGEPAATVTVAQAVVGSVGVYDQPDGQTITTLANPNETGAPLVFLVIDQQPGWFHVDLPVRPNGSTGWVRSGDVSTSEHDYRIDVELAQHRITVMQGSNLLLQTAIAVGTSDTPTPARTFYIKELLKPTDGAGNYIPDGDYGPFAYGLSGFSDVLTDFNGGNGELGIHGTNHPELLGTNVSHGCIRMSNEDITKLAGILPLGVPVRIFP